MAVSYPVHPDDALALLKIRRYLIGYRITEGMTQIELSRKVNGTEGVVHDLEANTTWQWRIHRLQDWCDAFGLRLTAMLWISPTINVKMSRDPVVSQLYLLSKSDSEVWKMSQRAYLTAGLRAARQFKGIRTVDLGIRMGCTPSAIRNWERDSDQIMLPKALHYARILGGHIELGWTEKNGQA